MLNTHKTTASIALMHKDIKRYEAEVSYIWLWNCIYCICVWRLPLHLWWAELRPSVHVLWRPVHAREDLPLEHERYAWKLTCWCPLPHWANRINNHTQPRSESCSLLKDNILIFSVFIKITSIPKRAEGGKAKMWIFIIMIRALVVRIMWLSDNLNRLSWFVE